MKIILSSTIIGASWKTITTPILDYIRRKKKEANELKKIQEANELKKIEIKKKIEKLIIKRQLKSFIEEIKNASEEEQGKINKCVEKFFEEKKLREESIETDIYFQKKFHQLIL